MTHEKKREKVLVTVKTYPTLSGKYDELVCTTGFREDGSWVRIYPIPFRKKSYDEQYSKYDWIEIDLVKNTSDFRPESFRPYSHDSEINIVGRHRLRLDIGFGDTIVDGPIEMDYPAMLEFPAPIY